MASLSPVSADAWAAGGGKRAAQAGQRMEVAVRVAARVGTEARQRSQRRRWPGLMVYVSSVSRGATWGVRWGVRWGGTRVGGRVRTADVRCPARPGAGDGPAQAAPRVDTWCIRGGGKGGSVAGEAAGGGVVLGVAGVSLVAWGVEALTTGQV